jgi:hypothetical protein
LISNALTRSFRASTYNLGNNISNTITINASLGDVQYGTISGNTTIQFAGWAPAGTQSNLQLQLNIASNSNPVISFPSQVSMTGSYGVETLENFANVGNVATVSIPYGVTQLEYRLSTIDCGNNITIEPFNRPRIDTQIQQRTPSPTGFQGDVAGTVAVDANYIYVATDTYDANTTNKLVSNTTVTSNLITFTTSTGLVDPTDLNIPVIFTGNTFGGIVANAVYYVKTIASANTITISDSISSNVAGPTFALTTAGANNATFTATFYRGTDIWKSIKLLPIGEPVTVDDLSVLGNAVIQGNLTVDGVVIGDLNASNINTANLTITGIFQANTFSGNINAVNLDVSGVANIPTVADIRIGGGLNGYYLVTDGTGNLTWVSGGGSGNGVVSGSNTQIQYNNAGNFGATAGFTFDSATNLLSTPGAITATGNITGSNINTSGIVTASRLISNIATGTAPLTVTSTTQVANLNVATAGTVITAAQPNITSVGTLSSISVSGNANIGNIGTGGLILATGNITGGNVTSNSYVIVSAANSISAAGTVQANATQLTNSINVVTTVSAGSGVKLPVAEAGMRIIVRNSTSTILNVYPNTGAAIEPALANAAYTLNATTSMEFFCSTGGASGQWFTLF